MEANPNRRPGDMPAPGLPPGAPNPAGQAPVVPRNRVNEVARRRAAQAANGRPSQAERDAAIQQLMIIERQHQQRNVALVRGGVARLGGGVRFGVGNVVRGAGQLLRGTGGGLAPVVPGRGRRIRGGDEGRSLIVPPVGRVMLRTITQDILTEVGLTHVATQTVLTELGVIPPGTRPGQADVEAQFITRAERLLIRLMALQYRVIHMLLEADPQRNITVALSRMDQVRAMRVSLQRAVQQPEQPLQLTGPVFTATLREMMAPMAPRPAATVLAGAVAARRAVAARSAVANNRQRVALPAGNPPNAPATRDELPIENLAAGQSLEENTSFVDDFEGQVYPLSFRLGRHWVTENTVFSVDAEMHAGRYGNWFPTLVVGPRFEMGFGRVLRAGSGGHMGGRLFLSTSGVRPSVSFEVGMTEGIGYKSGSFNILMPHDLCKQLHLPRETGLGVGFHSESWDNKQFFLNPTFSDGPNLLGSLVKPRWRVGATFRLGGASSEEGLLLSSTDGKMTASQDLLASREAPDLLMRGRDLLLTTAFWMQVGQTGLLVIVGGLGAVCYFKFLGHNLKARHPLAKGFNLLVLRISVIFFPAAACLLVIDWVLAKGGGFRLRPVLDPVFTAGEGFFEGHRLPDTPLLNISGRVILYGVNTTLACGALVTFYKMRSPLALRCVFVVSMFLITTILSAQMRAWILNKDARQKGLGPSD